MPFDLDKYTPIGAQAEPDRRTGFDLEAYTPIGAPEGAPPPFDLETYTPVGAEAPTEPGALPLERQPVVPTAEPGPEDRPFITQLGRGLASGVLGLGKAVGTGIRVLGAVSDSDVLREYGYNVADFWQSQADKFRPTQNIAKRVWDNPEVMLEPDWWAYNVGQIAPTLAASLIPAVTGARVASWAGRALNLTPKTIAAMSRLGLTARGAALVAGGTAGGFLEGSSTYDNVLARGGSETQAGKGLAAMTLASGVLNSLSLGQILNRSPLRAAAWEAVTEYLEEPTEAGIIKVLDLARQDETVWEAFKNVDVIGPAFVTGLLGGIAAPEIRAPAVPGPVAPPAEPVVPSAEEAAPPPTLPEVEAPPIEPVITPIPAPPTLPEVGAEAEDIESVARLTQRAAFTGLTAAPAVTDEQKMVRDIVKEITGKRTVFYSGETGTRGAFDPAQPDVLFVSDTSRAPLIFAGMHEATHTIFRDTPEDGELLMSMMQELDPERYTAWTTRLADARAEVITGEVPALDEQAMAQEFVADFVGEQATNRTFWEGLYDRSPAIFQRLMDMINRLFDAVTTMGAPEIYGTEAIFANTEALAKARQTISVVFRERLREAGPGPLAAEVVTRAQPPIERPEVAPRAPPPTLPEVGAPPVFEKGQPVFVRKRKGLKKLHRAKIVNVIDEKTLQVSLYGELAKGRAPYLTVPVDLVTQYTAKETLAKQRDELKALPAERRKAVRAESRELDRVLEASHLWNEELAGAPAVSKREESMNRHRALVQAREAAAEAIGEPTLDITSVVTRAEMLPKVTAWLRTQGAQEARIVDEMERAKFDARRGYTIEVNESELDPGTLIWRDGEWHTVEAVDAGKRLVDGMTLELADFENVEVGVVVEPGEPAYDIARREFDVQREAAPAIEPPTAVKFRVETFLRGAPMRQEEMFDYQETGFRLEHEAGIDTFRMQQEREARDRAQAEADRRQIGLPMPPEAVGPGDIRYSIRYRDWEPGLRPELRDIKSRELLPSGSSNGHPFEYTKRVVDGKEKYVIFSGDDLIGVFDESEQANEAVNQYYLDAAVQRYEQARLQQWHERALASGLSDAEIFAHDSAVMDYLGLHVEPLTEPTKSEQLTFYPEPTPDAANRIIRYSINPQPEQAELGNLADARNDRGADISGILDFWFANKDDKIQAARSEAARIQNGIMAITQPQIRPEKRKFRSAEKEIDQAIQVFIDLKNAEERGFGTPAEQFAKFRAKLSEAQRRIYERSQALGPAELTIAEEIRASNRATGIYAMEADVTHNVFENYTMRLWKQTAADRQESTLRRKFGTSTARAKHRTLESILEGWSRDMELRIEGASNAMETMQEEIHETVQDRAMLKQSEKSGLISDRQHEGWQRIEHPNFVSWKWAGKVEPGKVYGKNFFQTEDGTLYERRTMYGEPEMATRLNKILGTSKLNEVPGIPMLTRINSELKHTILTTSFFHHQAFARSYVLGARTGLKEVNPIAAYKKGLEAIVAYKPEVRELVRGGLTIGRIQDWNEASWNQEQTRVGKIIDGIPGAAQFKAGFLRFRDIQTKFLFNRFGPGLKMQAGLLEFQHEIKKNDKALAEGKITRHELAVRVANLINDDFGGLHLGRMERSPTAQHIFRLFALAPDWTESNVRSMVKAFRAGDEGTMYRAFWGRIAAKGLIATTLFNLLMSAFDDEDFWEREKKAWETGNLRWLGIDITPLHRAVGGQSESRKYFSLVGHFRDPIKFIAHPVRSAKHKSSVIGRLFMDAITGQDWAARRFTTTAELLGVDDKGVYRTTRAGFYRVGQPKGGRLIGRTVTRVREPGRPLEWEQIPSWMINEARSVLPIQMQSAITYIAGELDGFDAISRALGLYVTTAYPRAEPRPTRRRRRLLPREGLMRAERAMGQLSPADIMGGTRIPGAVF